MKNVICVIAMALSILSNWAMAATAIVDSFDYGSTVAWVSNDVQYGSTYDPLINSSLPGSDHTRYWLIYTKGEGNAGSFNTGITPGSIVMTKTHYGRITLGYQFSPPTDLSGFSAVNILGSGMSSDEGSRLVHGSFDLFVTDSDGSTFSTFVSLTGAVGDITMNFSDLMLAEAGSDSILNLAQVTALEVSAWVPYSTSSFTYTLSEINLIPEPATMLLLGLGGMFIRTAKIKVKSPNFERKEK